MVQKQKMIRKKSKQLAKLKQATSTDNNLNVSDLNFQNGRKKAAFYNTTPWKF